MTIRYKCAECGAVLNIKDELAGTQGHCPRCEVEFTVPAAEESNVADKAPAAVGGEAAVERSQRPAGGLSEDDIGDILASEGPVSSARNEPEADNSFDEEAEPPDDQPRKKRSKPRPAEDEVDVDEPSEEEDDDDSDLRRIKKRKRSEKGTPKADSAESASIARTLMGRGDRAIVRDEKKGGRPFGGTDGRGEERPDYSYKDIGKYIASIGWPAAVGVVVLIGVCWGIIHYLSPKLNLPPLAEVTGTVTFDGKPLPKDSIVRFQPISGEPNQNLNLATSFGFTDEKGMYRLTYLVIDEKRISGAVLGKHMVVIQAKDEVGAELLPLKYSSSRSELRADVVKGGPPINFDLKPEPEPAP